MPPLAAMLAGWAASHVTLTALFGGAGLCLVGVALLAWIVTPLRTVRAADPKREDGLA